MDESAKMFLPKNPLERPIKEWTPVSACIKGSLARTSKLFAQRT